VELAPRAAAAAPVVVASPVPVVSPAPVEVLAVVVPEVMVVAAVAQPTAAWAPALRPMVFTVTPTMADKGHPQSRF
jgi:hypothetical protein